MHQRSLLKLMLLFVVCCCYAYTQAQTKTIDSLLQVLKNTNNTAEEYEINFKLGGLYIENAPPKSIPYTQRAMQLAKQLKDNLKLGFVYHQTANYLEKTGAFDDALTNITTAQKYINNTREGSKLFILTNNTKGSVLRRQAKYEDAAKAFLASTAKAEEIKNDTLLYAAQTQLGILYVTLKDYDRAMAFHKNAIEIATRMNSFRRLAKSYGNIGIIYREQDKYAEGIQYNTKALEYAYLSGDSSSISYAMAELGTIYDRGGQSVKATPYLLQAIAIRERNNEQNELAYSYFYLGNNYARLKQFAESELWIRRGLNQALKIKNTKQVIDAYQTMYINFNESKKFDSAVIYLKKHVLLRDSLNSVTVKQKIEELNIKYDTQKKDLVIKDEKLKNSYLIASIVLLILLIAILYGAYVRRNLRHKNKLQQAIITEQDKATKAIIEAEENERQRIASDLHDGVGQYMTAAKMNLESLGEKLPFADDAQRFAYNNAIGLVNDSVGEVRSISHNMMPNALLKNGLGNAVRNFLDNINQQKIKVQLFTDGLNKPINANTEIFLYRIVQECVNNVLKHANASQLNISILADAKELDITIEDNGNGFNPDTLSQKAGIGIDNIHKRVLFLKGTVHWDSVPGNGTTVVINVPM